MLGMFVAPVRGRWIPSRLAVHHHFLFIGIQGVDDIVRLLDENRPELFSFYEENGGGEKVIKAKKILIVTT